MSNPLLSVENIETYYGPIMAIRGISFKVNQGSIVTILGSNGAGKTTILKTISGAIDPRKGKVYLNGSESYDPNGSIINYEWSQKRNYIQ